MSVSAGCSQDPSPRSNSNNLSRRASNSPPPEKRTSTPTSSNRHTTSYDLTSVGSFAGQPPVGVALGSGDGPDRPSGQPHFQRLVKALGLTRATRSNSGS